MADSNNPPPVNTPVDDLVEDPITKQKKTKLSFAWTAWFNAAFQVIKNTLSTDGVQTVSNKTLDNTNTITIKDSNLTIQDDGDTSKQLKIQASGISTATTRTMTVPDANFIVVGTTTTQTLTNKTLTSPVISTIVNTGTLTLPTSTDTLVGRATTDTLTNKTLDTAGTGNVLRINGNQVSSVTGTGSVVVLATSPTLVTPVLGVASATSINKVTITAPATGSTLTIADGKTATISNTLTFTGTDGSSVALGTGGTVAYASNNLSVFAATTSAQLAGVISDETGSGALVFGTSPTLTTPLLAGMTTTGSSPSAGGGGALPATPAGYVTISVNGSPVQIAYY